MAHVAGSTQELSLIALVLGVGSVVSIQSGDLTAPFAGVWPYQTTSAERGLESKMGEIFFAVLPSPLGLPADWRCGRVGTAVSLLLLIFRRLV
jgi:hypothetical protein